MLLYGTYGGMLRKTRNRDQRSIPTSRSHLLIGQIEALGFLGWTDKPDRP